MKNKIGPFFLAVLLSLCAALFATNTWAEDSKTWAEDIWTRDKLTGDWWGGRTYLSDHGIDIGLRLSQYYQGVTSGGVDQNSEYGGTMDYRLNVDTNKLFGTWKGLSVDMHARTR
jgi:porin